MLKLEHGAQAAAKDAAKDAGLSESDEEDENEGIRRVEPGQAAAAAASAAASAAMASSLTVCLSRSHMNFRLSSSVPDGPVFPLHALPKRIYACGCE